MRRDSLNIIESDKEYARQRIETLQKEIDDLGPEFNDAFTQTSETWHDNAPFEIVRDRQAMLYAEHQGLKAILQSSLPSVPKQNKNTVGIGAFVEVVDNGDKTIRYFMAGDWTPFAGRKLPGTTAVIVSREAPISKSFIGLREGDSFTFNQKEFRIVLVDYSFADTYSSLVK